MTPAAALREPAIRELDADNFVTLEPTIVYDAARSRVFTIPLGFVYDLASAPRGAYAMVDRLDCRTLPPCAHDWLYRHAGALPGVRYTRAEADALFLALMTRQGVGFVRRWAAYLGVRAGGASSWGGRPARVIPELADVDRS